MDLLKEFESACTPSPVPEKGMATGEGQPKRKAGKGTKKNKEDKADKPLRRTRTRGKKRRVRPPFQGLAKTRISKHRLVF